MRLPDYVPIIDTSISNVDFGDTLEWYPASSYGGGSNPSYGYTNGRGNSLFGGTLRPSDDSWGIHYGSSYMNFENIAEDSISGIFGLPYQFSEIVDPVIEYNGKKYDIGRKYSEKIFSIMPILFLTPGEPIFMNGASERQKVKIINGLMTVDGMNVDRFANTNDGRYYSFISSFTEFEQYANTALRALSIFMGIGDTVVPIPGTTSNVRLKNIRVSSFMNNAFTGLFGTRHAAPFYLDAEKSISENFSNSATDSMLSQTVNGFSQQAREIQFVMGSRDPGGILSAVGKAAQSLDLAGTLGDVGELFTGDSLLSRVTNELTTIVAGGKIVFPQIWSDSEFDRSYDISIKLRSPDPDPVSIFLNIYMPIIILVSMAAPRQMNGSANSYESPFLVRATYKSIFNCDLGLIESLSIEKGGEGNWNVMGHPTQANVTLRIKDLYSSMMISKRGGIVKNMAQMDYLSLMAGIDMNEISVDRLHRLNEIFINEFKNTPGDLVHGIWGRFKESANLFTTKILGKFIDVRPFT